MIYFFLRLFCYNYYKVIKTCFMSESKTRNELTRLQFDKFKALIIHAKRNIPYYRELLTNIEINNIRDISKIPFLTKEIIQQNYVLLQAENIIKKRFKKDSSSGSTGKATHFFTDKKLNVWRYACALRGDSWTGWRLGEPEVILWGAERDTKKSKSVIGKIKNSALFFNTTILSSFYMTDEDMLHYITTINKKKPTLLVGYPSSLEFFAYFIKKNEYRIHSPKGIITGGETLYSSQRKIIEDVFKAKVLNRYGCREVGHIANECEQQNGLHISFDHVIVEVINEKGELCKPGELGEIVVTDLDNYVFPLIRYKIGDVGVMSDKICDCGRPFPLLSSVEGRTFDLIVGVNNNTVLATFFTTFLRYAVKGIIKFQLIQEEINTLKLFVIIDDSFNEKEEEKIQHAFKEKLGDAMHIDIIKTSHIPLTDSGKFRWIISKVSPYIH